MNPSRQEQVCSATRQIPFSFYYKFVPPSPRSAMHLLPLPINPIPDPDSAFCSLLQPMFIRPVLAVLGTPYFVPNKQTPPQGHARRTLGSGRLHHKFQSRQCLRSLARPPRPPPSVPLDWQNLPASERRENKNGDDWLCLDHLLRSSGWDRLDRRHFFGPLKRYNVAGVATVQYVVPLFRYASEPWDS